MRSGLVICVTCSLQRLSDGRGTLEFQDRIEIQERPRG